MNEFEDAQTAQTLREQIRHLAEEAAYYGHVNKEWINTRLAAMGVQPLTGKSEYRMLVPITGAFGWRVKASSRAEAMAAFQRQMARVASAGKITAEGSYDNVYQVKIVGEPSFYSGPEDAEATDPTELDLAGLKTAIREMLKEGVSLYGWGHSHAVSAAEAMGLPSLPSLVTKTVEVPVSGTYTTTVQAFADDTNVEVQQRVAAAIGASKSVQITADEVGDVQIKADKYEEPAEDEPENDEVF